MRWLVRWWRLRSAESDTEQEVEQSRLNLESALTLQDAVNALARTGEELLRRNHITLDIERSIGGTWKHRH